MNQSVPSNSPLSTRETVPVAIVKDQDNRVIGVREAQVLAHGPGLRRQVQMGDVLSGVNPDRWQDENAFRTYDAEENWTASVVAGGLAAVDELRSDPCLSVSGYCLRLNDNLLQYNVTLAPLPDNRASVVVQNRAFENGGIGPWNSISTLTGEHKQAGRMFSDMLEQGMAAMQRWKDDGVGIVGQSALVRAAVMMPQALQTRFDTLGDEIPATRQVSLCSTRVNGFGLLAF